MRTFVPFKPLLRVLTASSAALQTSCLPCGMLHHADKPIMGVPSRPPKLLCMHLQRRDDVISQCTMSVRCDPSTHRMGNAVVDIYAINLQLGAMAVCTGINKFPTARLRSACMLYAFLRIFLACPSSQSVLVPCGNAMLTICSDGCA